MAEEFFLSIFNIQLIFNSLNVTVYSNFCFRASNSLLLHQPLVKASLQARDYSG